jgi:MraZ protein
LIPPFLREYADLKSQIIFAGLGSNIELWDKGRWEEERARAKESLASINEAMARLGI